MACAVANTRLFKSCIYSAIILCTKNTALLRGLRHVQPLTLTPLTWTIWRAPTNAIKWRMGFNSAFKRLTGNLQGLRMFQNYNPLLYKTKLFCEEYN